MATRCSSRRRAPSTSTWTRCSRRPIAATDTVTPFELAPDLRNQVEHRHRLDREAVQDDQPQAGQRKARGQGPQPGRLGGEGPATRSSRSRPATASGPPSAPRSRRPAPRPQTVVRGPGYDQAEGDAQEHPQGDPRGAVAVHDQAVQGHEDREEVQAAPSACPAFSTPTGKWKVTGKVKNPSWHNPG